MSVVLRRLNGDTSWWLSWGGTSLVIDPWLNGPQVDGFRWFSEQQHVQPVVGAGAVQRPDAIVLTQRYSDHLHLPTIADLETEHGPLPMICVQAARRKLKRNSRNTLGVLTTAGVSVGDLHLQLLRPTKRLPPLFNALLIENQENEVVLYAPHGIQLSDDDWRMIAAKHVKVLMTCTSTYRLPPWLGGLVLPGLEAAQRLVDQVRPELVLDTHDEPKAAAGLVARVAERVDVQLADQLTALPGFRAAPAIGSDFTVA